MTRNETNRIRVILKESQGMVEVFFRERCLWRLAKADSWDSGFSLDRHVSGEVKRLYI